MNKLISKSSIPAHKPQVIGSRKIRYTLSTSDTVDRDNDVIAGPWQLDEYKLNPVVMAFHDYRSVPVARTTQIAQVGSELIAEAEFVPAEISADAEKIFQMVKGGWMPGCSVGFLGVDDPKPNRYGGLTYGAVKLLEWSVTPIPSHPGALAKALRATEPDEAMMARAAHLAASLVIAAEEGIGSMRQFIRELPPHEQRIVEEMIESGEL
jgi:hypothetical protein